MNTLTGLELHGFKSIRHLTDLRLGPLNVLIGANGAGKSNLISFFRLLNRMTRSPGELQSSVAKMGGANAILFDGAAVTPQIEAKLALDTKQAAIEYRVRLAHSGADTLTIDSEQYRFARHHGLDGTSWHTIGSGRRESGLAATGVKDHWILGTVVRIAGSGVYHFHDTSETARIRQKWGVGDSRPLKEDGANLAPFLLRLRNHSPVAYARIVATLHLILPFFADFELQPVDRSLLLQWRERGSDVVYGAHQASDGMLRLMALVALLLQPSDELPEIIILDEPELGLHPYALNVVAGFLRSASTHTQVILATQSAELVDHFEPEEIVVVERAEPADQGSQFRRLEPERLREWLEDYSLGELWQKNVIGGRPGR